MILILSSKPLLACANIGGNRRGVSPPRVTNSINWGPDEDPHNTEFYYEVLHHHHRVQPWNRAERAPNVRLRHGSTAQEIGPLQRQEQRFRLFPQTGPPAANACSAGLASAGARAARARAAAGVSGLRAGDALDRHVAALVPREDCRTTAER